MEKFRNPHASASIRRLFMYGIKSVVSICPFLDFESLICRYTNVDCQRHPFWHRVHCQQWGQSGWRANQRAVDIVTCPESGNGQSYTTLDTIMTVVMRRREAIAILKFFPFKEIPVMKELTVGIDIGGTTPNLELWIVMGMSCCKEIFLLPNYDLSMPTSRRCLQLFTRVLPLFLAIRKYRNWSWSC